MRSRTRALLRLRRHPFALAAAFLTVTALLVGGGVATTASAKDDYPTYADLVAARKDVTKTAALIKRIEASLQSLSDQAASTAATAQRYGDLAQQADEKYQVQALKADELQSQADDAKADADAATAQAAEMVSRLYRAGSGDISLDLLLNSDHASDLLYSYGIATKLTEQTQALYENAKQKQNSAQSLSDQAEVARSILEQYKNESEAAAAKASSAAQAAADALAAEEAHKAQLEELEAAAKAKAAVTAAQYQKGVEARQAALAAANGNQSNPQSPYIRNGWALPEYGPITSPFGWRALNGGRTYHLGTDIGAACGTAEYAAHEGTVSYAGWNGVYGNFIRIDVGAGIQIEYGHIKNGGIQVKVGQAVGAGQIISYVGKTGAATGCHLHYGVRINGLVTDPVPFMKQRGITLGT